ncbi:hypothetical protein KR074_005837, partial [Drosophila pseudoananassae]
DPEHNLWQLTSHIKRPKKRVAQVRKPDGEWCRSDHERADAFAAHLEDAFTPFNRCSEVDQAETERFLSLPCTDFCQLEPVSEEEVQEEVSGLNTKKSPGADGLEALAIKLLPPLAIQRLTSIFNACLEIGHFPSDWKKAEKNTSSALNRINSCVPQGPVLGPILYTLYTAELPGTNACTVATYADDTAVLATSISKNEASKLLQRELSLIEDWFLRWKIRINSLKSVQITFS